MGADGRAPRREDSSGAALPGRPRDQDPDPHRPPDQEKADREKADREEPDRQKADREKAVLRRSVLDRRRRRGTRERAALAGQLRDVVLAAGVLPADGAVACYSSRGTEPGTWPLVAALAAQGRRVLLPHTHDGSDGGGVRLGWGVAHGTAGSPDGPPLPGPDLGPDALAEVVAVLVPALAVDTAGRRLGRGGGYYDRALGRLVAAGGALPPVVALVHEDEVLDACVEPVPSADHDVRVAHVATASRWRRLD
ncbi:5-formyltetrahydrofolate cyclo-ligase [Pseudokineococcus basanitobsidens]|uniref:5-formyltetrahydrofolate cyclo-ligase n=1 Tax=Pseudokineococcus basanitobsidens TaxID=1926649 RepID=A0ABU8RPB2_9ACTN